MKARRVIGICLIVCLFLGGSVYFTLRALALRRAPAETGLQYPTPAPPRTAKGTPVILPEYISDADARFAVHTSAVDFQLFLTLADAYAHARGLPSAQIYDLSTQYLLWDNEEALPESVILSGVPHVAQNPELPRGCEVTSLAMLLNYVGIPVDKLTLAEQVAKDDTPLSRENGVTTYGSPNRGFVGSMTNMRENGLGVYHGPIFDLLKAYCPGAVDATDCGFDAVRYYLSKGRPVWVIVTSSFRVLPESAFETWQTADGELRITYSEHSVLLTGYDEAFVYFNDPLGGEGKAARAAFTAAWEQMGGQAVSCAP